MHRVRRRHFRGKDEGLLRRSFCQAAVTPVLIRNIAAAGAATWAAGSFPSTAFAKRRPPRGRFDEFRALGPSSADELQVPDGYAHDVLISWGEEFGRGLTFGYNCDYSTWFPFRSHPEEGLLFVSHEYVIPFFTSDWLAAQDPSWDPRSEPYRSIMEAEKKEVGASILHLKRTGNDGRWRVKRNSHFSRRFYGDGPVIPYDGPATGVLPSEGVLGTLANCSGGHTPWGTVLRCEENYQSYGLDRQMPFALGWIRDDGSTPEEVNYYVGEPGRNVDGQPATELPYYGYVAEIDPYSGQAVKHTALGRIHHENVGMRIAADGRVVCYTGDDAPAADGMFFKFVSTGKYRRGMGPRDGMRLLSEGQLYVAQWFPTANNPEVDSGTGRWHALDMNDPDALTFTTKWVEANIVPTSGGDLTQFRVPRAEDGEVLPDRPTDVLISLTSARGRPTDPTAYGIVRLLREDTADPDGLTFSWVDLLEGGQDAGFSNPDNLGFSSPDELWVVTDVSTSRLNRPPFEWHGNNAILFVPLDGPSAHTAFRFANAPVEAELTGPTFNDAENTLFINVQHPGEETPNRGGVPGEQSTYTSWWPDGNRTAGTGRPGKPKPSLVAIRKL
ncbi:MAG: PhoX family protein [Actinomycetota bacterium]